MVLRELDPGGGQGVPSSGDHGALDLPALADVIGSTVAQVCAGVALHRVVSVTSVRGGRTSVAQDGGTGDNRRVGLHGTGHDVVLVHRHPLGPGRTVTEAGRLCEAGDVVARDVGLPVDLHPGDLLAVPCAGAHHHCPASTCDVVGRPPVVAVRDGASRRGSPRVRGRGARPRPGLVRGASSAAR